MSTASGASWVVILVARIAIAHWYTNSRIAVLHTPHIYNKWVSTCFLAHQKSHDVRILTSSHGIVPILTLRVVSPHSLHYSIALISTPLRPDSAYCMVTRGCPACLVQLEHPRTGKVVAGCRQCTVHKRAFKRRRHVKPPQPVIWVL